MSPYSGNCATVGYRGGYVGHCEEPSGHERYRTESLVLIISQNPLTIS